MYCFEMAGLYIELKRGVTVHLPVDAAQDTYARGRKVEMLHNIAFHPV